VPMTPAARSWLARPELARLWDTLHERLQRNGIAIRGRLLIPDPSHAEREALGLLMGRAYPAGTISIALADLDERLRSSAAGCGAADAVAELRGRLTNRPAVRSARRAERDQVWVAADEAMAAAGLAEAPWAPGWLDEIRRGGALTRLAPDRAVSLIAQAVVVLSRLVPQVQPPGQAGIAPPGIAQAGIPSGIAPSGIAPSGIAPSGIARAGIGRGELAERVTGTAHGLDDDTVLARLVLRGLARSRDEEFPRDARGRRELWQAAGVATDQVWSTVLTYGLMPLGDDWPARMLRERSASRAETHLTMRDLRRMQWRLPPGTEIFVCENPRVVEAAADAACRRPLVCTSGNPTTTVLALLDTLTAAGARLAYRGDFDWPGVAMANRILARYDARPWRMSAADYEQHVHAARDRATPLQPLSGQPVVAEWDPELAPAMQALGVGVQEESALELLLTDLS
jgi:hypothetical protein